VPFWVLAGLRNPNSFEKIETFGDEHGDWEWSSWLPKEEVWVGETHYAQFLHALFWAISIVTVKPLL
jgi:hypothetical protein